MSLFLRQLFLDLVYLIVSPLLFLGLLIVSRGFTREKFRRGLLQKFGRVPRRRGDTRSLWVHAVSVGEVQTALPLVRAFRERHPDWDVSVSVTTFTGYAVAKKNLSDLDVFYAPIDFSPIVSTVFWRRRPDAIVLIELELWPNFLIVARRRRVPVVVANGRMTERSSRRYAALGGLTRQLFRLVDGYAVQSEEYRERFLRVGVDPARMEVLGNLKHDREPAVTTEESERLRTGLGWGSGEHGAALVLVAGSTHPGEEETLCRIHDGLKRDHPELRLVLALRHVERLSSTESLPDWGSTDPMVRWSHIRQEVVNGRQSLANGGDSVLVVDTVGELEAFYSIADVVFVGGTLIPHGGQNLFEPASLGRAVVFGPHYQNFLVEGTLLLEEEAALCVSDAEELETALRRLVDDAGERDRLGKRASDLTRGLRGATRRHVDWIDGQIGLPLSLGD